MTTQLALPLSSRLCGVDGCATPIYCRGLCKKHHSRWKKHGTTNPPVLALPVNERRRILFKGKIRYSSDPTACWLFVGCTGPDGYGHLGWSENGKTRGCRAHRFAYELWVGPIPVGLEIDHLCRVRNCVNPLHLEPVTHAENVRRSVHVLNGFALLNAAKTHCIHGHEFTPENTFTSPARPTARRCKECAREADRRRWPERSRLRSEKRRQAS